MSRTLRLVLILLGLASPVAAQVTGPPHVFVANTVASPDEVNLNFSTIYDNALNRTGGTMTGNLLFSADNTLDIGASGANRPRDLFLGRNAAVGGTLAVAGVTTLSGNLLFSADATRDIGASGATRPRDLFLSRNAVIGGTLGVTGASTLAALSATTGSFSSTLGVTGLATLTGGATSAGDIRISAAAPNFRITETDQALDTKQWLVRSAASVFEILAVNDAESAGTQALTITRTTTTPVLMTITPAVVFNDYLVLDSVAQALLGGGGNGTIVYCTDCNRATTPCTGGGTGALAVQINGAFACF